MSVFALQGKISDFLQSHRQQMLEDLAQLIAVPSVVAEPLPGKPYGAAPHAVMLRAEAIARRMGFVTKISDDSCLTAEYGDRPAKLCLLAHLDVVDAGEGWTYPPYALTVTEDRIYGRGVADDKGPAIALLYAMQAARAVCPELPYSPQAWLGTAEEVGSPELRRYMTHTPLPPVCLTPDALEPIVIGESAKHRPAFFSQWAESSARPQVLALEGGKVRNAIPGYAEATVAGLCRSEVEPQALACTRNTEVNFELTDTPEGLHIRACGRGAHIGHPELGRNAQTALVALLAALPLADCPSTRALRALAACFPYGDLAGTGLGLTVADELMGPSRTNFTMCRLTPTGVWCKLDSRGPRNATPENYAQVIDSALRRAGFTVEPSEMDVAHYVPESDPLVQQMKTIYEHVYHRPATCHFSIGASYAHYIPGAVSTGAAMPEIDTMLHKSDEFLPLDDLMRIAESYALAILTLCGHPA